MFVERVAREERRVQEESEPLCQKVSRNVVINFRLHTFEISLEFHPYLKLFKIVQTQLVITRSTSFCCVREPERSGKCCS